MLDKYLEIAFQEQQKTAARNNLVELMTKLPVEELFKICETGKLASSFSNCGDGGSETTWLDHFKDTPLYPQAIALEEEELKMDAARDQQNNVADQERHQVNQQRDALRMEKKLLELELAKLEAGQASAAAAPPPPTPGMGAPPGMGEQGAGAPGDMAPEGAGAPDSAPGKFGSAIRFKYAVAKMKQAGVGDYLKAMAPAVGAFVKEHPGAAIGGALGAAHGLMHRGGGLGSAVLEGAGGAALGHGAQHMYEGGTGEKLRNMFNKLAPEPDTATVALEPGAGGAAKMGAAMKPLPFVDSEKRAFGALLGALGGALAGSGLRAGLANAAKTAVTSAAGAAGGAGGMGGLASKAMNFVKANPMKAIGAGMNAAQNFSQARQSGQGIGGAALSGLAGGASALG